MGKILTKLLIMIVIIALAFIGGMISPGEKLDSVKHEVNKYYNKIRFSKIPVAQGFLSNPFDLKLAYVENTEGQLEVFLINTEKPEMLPIFEVAGTTQVGDLKHRLQGVKDEGQDKLQDIFEEGSSAIDKALKFLGE